MEVDIRSMKYPTLSKMMQQEMSWAVAKPFVENGGRFLLGGAVTTLTDMEGFTREENGSVSGSCKSY